MFVIVCEQPIKLQNGFVDPRVTVEQQARSGDEIGKDVVFQTKTVFYSAC